MLGSGTNRRAYPREQRGCPASQHIAGSPRWHPVRLHLPPPLWRLSMHRLNQSASRTLPATPICRPRLLHCFPSLHCSMPSLLRPRTQNAQRLVNDKHCNGASRSSPTSVCISSSKGTGKRLCCLASHLHGDRVVGFARDVAGTPVVDTNGVRSGRRTHLAPRNVLIVHAVNGHNPHSNRDLAFRHWRTCGPQSRFLPCSARLHADRHQTGCPMRHSPEPRPFQLRSVPPSGARIPRRFRRTSSSA